MIYITGDVHGKIGIERLRAYFKKKYVSRKDYLIILGDAGIVWSKDTIERYIFEFSILGPTIYFIDGNHENFDMLDTYPQIKINNAFVHVIADGIYHVLRGEILILNDLKFLCIGGAESIDKSSRMEGISWWKNETITEHEIDHAIYEAAVCDLKVDYVLTHSAPTSIVKDAFGFNPSESNIQLDRILDKIEFKKWYFGHYHADRIISDKFRCFYNDVLEIPAIDSDKDIKYRILCGNSIYIPSTKYPYLRNWETGKYTKLTSDDLPEWYYKDFAYRDWYYCLKGVSDVAYHGSPFDNHINKDSSIYLSYDGEIEKNSDYSPKDKEKHINTWRVDIVRFTNGLEKYSPNLDLRKLKEKINLTYDRYNRNSFNYYDGVMVRPYPEIETESIKDIKYRVIENSNILCEFYDFESAKKYANTYVSKNLNLKYVRIIENNTNELSFDTSHDINKWLKIERVIKK